MRIAFFGHRMIAHGALESLVSAGKDVVGIVAHPDSFEPSDPDWSAAVRSLAEGAGIELATPGKTDEELITTLRRWNADLGVVVGYLAILKPPVLELPSHGFINIHAGMLPRYRGRAPLAWAVMNGEKEAGLTIHYIDEGVDSGPIIAQRQYGIQPDETAGELYGRIEADIPEFVLDVVDRFEAGPVDGTPQDEDRAMCFPFLTPAHARIDWSRPARRIHDQVRALARPYPGAWTLYRDKRLIVWKTRVLDTNLPDCFPGTVINRRLGHGVTVSTGSGYLVVDEVQRPGKESKPAADIIRRAGVSLGLEPSETTG
jgi:methionyl-tRNA formyltransferase